MTTPEAGLTSWVRDADGHPDFPIQNLPLCVFTRAGEPAAERRGGIRIADQLLDLAALAGNGLLSGEAQQAAASANRTLNALFALGASPRRELRRQVQQLLRTGAARQADLNRLLTPVEDCVLYLPANVGDYTDFYAGIHHARGVGALFRPDNPLLPNYGWVPIGYHGRASTVQVSGTPVRRPHGQTAGPGGRPTFGPSARLDFELELGVWAGASPTPGEPVPIARAADQVAGFCLLNDWSARDVQSWEYQPLGPFLAKNFATTVSPYVVTPEALAPYRAALQRPAGYPDPLPYLAHEADLDAGGLDVELTVALNSEQMRRGGLPELVLSRSSTRHLFWTTAQLIAHHTCGGCELRPGDLLGTGTISAPDDAGLGSMLEISHNATAPITLPSGETRTFLMDGDEVVLRGRASRPGCAPVGFGECRARLLPAASYR